MKAVRLSPLPAALVLLLSLAVSLPLFADAGDPPTRVARLSYLRGNVSFEPAGENQWSQASLNYSMTTGDRIFTDARSRAELETGNIALRVDGNTDLTTTDLGDQIMQFGLAQGALRVRAYEMLPGGSVEVDTPTVALTITQPGSYRIDTDPNAQTTTVSVDSGYLEVTGANLNQTVRGGQSLRVSGNPLQADYVGLPSRDDFDRWSANRDPRYLDSPSAQYVSRAVPGYYDLDSYGAWSPATAYGPVWYPTAVPVGWAPYRYGRWAWIAPWGWTWVDNEPWGFAPFHYGRWAYIGNRWGWCPGAYYGGGFYRPVYSPALVAFVGGSGFSLGFGFGGGGITAWFPLGPREPYYPWYHHSAGYLRQVNITNVRNVTSITNVNNINTTRYVNRNVAVTAVRTDTFRTAQPVARNIVRVNQQELARAQVLAHPQAAPVARALTVGKPLDQPPVAAARPAVVRFSVAEKQGDRVITPAREPATAFARGIATAHPAPPAAALNGDRPESALAQTDRPQFVTRNRPTPFRTPRGNTSATLPPAAAARADNPSPGTIAPRNPVSDRPRFVTRNAPPAPRPSFAQQEPALQQHPGRPLEPQQLDNLSRGRPAGPMRDLPAPAQNVSRANPVPPAAYRPARVERAVPAYRAAPAERPGPLGRPAPEIRSNGAQRPVGELSAAHPKGR